MTEENTSDECLQEKFLEIRKLKIEYDAQKVNPSKDFDLVAWEKQFDEAHKLLIHLLAMKIKRDPASKLLPENVEMV